MKNKHSKLIDCLPFIESVLMNEKVEPYTIDPGLLKIFYFIIY